MRSQQEELATELSLTKERLEITSELHDQSLEDTESWTVRVQILALELAEANTQVIIYRCGMELVKLSLHYAS